jgi:hypothetical protein
MDHYLAQIATVIVQGHAKNPRSIKMKDFLLRRAEDAPLKKESSKQIWLKALNITTPDI